MASGKRIVLVLCVTMMIIVALTFSILAKSEVISRGELVKLADEVSKVTGLPFKQLPKIVFANREEFADISQRENDALLNSIRGDAMLREIELLISSPYKYSWIDKTLYYNKEISIPCEKFMLIHELVLLQDDQYYGIENLIGLITDRESLLSILSIIEGHAYGVALQVAANLQMNDTETVWYLSHIPILYPVWNVYEKGMHFISYVTSHSQITVADIFNHPPLNANLVLEPETYISGGWTSKQKLIDRFADFGKNMPWYFKIVETLQVDPLSILATSSPDDENMQEVDKYIQGITCAFMVKVEQKPEVTYSIDEFQQLVEKGNTDSEFGEVFFAVSVLELNSAESATRFYELMTKEIVRGSYPHDTRYEYIYEIFPSTLIFSDVSAVDEDENGEVVYERGIFVTSILESHFLVQLVFINLEPAEEELFQVLDQIKKRLLLTALPQKTAKALGFCLFTCGNSG